MTEAEWLACEEPQLMWIALSRMDKRSERKRRLFAAACCRRILKLIADQRSWTAVAVVERYADGEASPLELSEAEALARAAQEDVISTPPPGVQVTLVTGVLHASGRTTDPLPRTTLRHVTPVSVAVLAAKRNFRPQSVGFEMYQIATEGDTAEWREQAGTIRDLFGNPFRPVTIDPAWLSWNGGTIPTLARAVYEERELPSGHLDPVRLALMADMLEDAGCTDSAILEHLRGVDPHVRGCWAVDWLLGKK